MVPSRVPRFDRARRALIAGLVTLLVAGCTAAAPCPFVGEWDGEEESITITERGFGSRRLRHLRLERTFTWKLAADDRIILEFGENTATRMQLEGRIQADGTLLLSGGPDAVVLKRQRTRRQ